MIKKNRLVLLCGANQSGKTYTIINKIIPKNTLKRTVIVNCSCEKDYTIFTKIKNIQDAKKYKNGEILYYNIEKRELINKQVIEIARAVFSELIQLTNTLIILDDVRVISNANTANLFKTLCVSYAQNNNNIVIVYHSVNDIQNDIVPHATHLLIFKTSDILRKDMPKQDEIIQKMEKVNQKNEQGFFELVTF
jgi:Asp-tRNA(Asn)/Glu-tRNA(Gln) amidotransferase C subunit